MDFARQQRDPARHLVGITVVVLLHAIVIYLLLTGVGKRAIEVIKKPLTATIIEEIKPPPPPPPPPPKKIEIPKAVKPPPQPYVPPPEVPVPPPIAPPPISAVTTTPPPEPVTIAPPVVEPPAPPAPPAPPPKPAVRRGIVPIEREDPSYPREAIKAGIDKGRVLARLQINEQGLVTDVQIVSSTNRVFDRAVREALAKWKFKPDGEKYVGEVEVNFTLKDE